MTMNKVKKVKVYTIFDDYTDEAARILRNGGTELTIHPMGKARPDAAEMKSILQEYDAVIIGTSQKITEDMFDGIDTPRIIATASVGTDHISIPGDKKDMVRVVNTPLANAQSVAEYVMACALGSVKRLSEASELYREGRNNKELAKKPEDLSGRSIGVIGAGAISQKIMLYAKMMGMYVYCWTRNPEGHPEVKAMGVSFCSLEEAVEKDVISVNLPNVAGTKNLISADMVDRMKDGAVFISVSRLDTIDIKSLIDKASANKNFYVCVDIDVDEDVVGMLEELDESHQSNVIITPHIAGGTIETRKRMFKETAEGIAGLIQNRTLDEMKEGE